MNITLPPLPASWSELSWQQITDVWRCKMRYGGNPDVAIVAAMLALYGLQVEGRPTVSDRTGEGIYRLRGSDGRVWTATARELSHYAHRQVFRKTRLKRKEKSMTHVSLISSKVCSKMEIPMELFSVVPLPLTYSHNYCCGILGCLRPSAETKLTDSRVLRGLPNEAMPCLRILFAAWRSLSCCRPQTGHTHFLSCNAKDL